MYGITPAISLFAFLLAVTATVLAFIFIVPEKKAAKLGKFGKFVHDTVNFKYLIIEKLLQALYIFLTAFVVLAGFFMLFMFNEWTDTWYGGYGLLTMILGPIAVRLVYELIMMAIILVKNVIQINNKMVSNGEDDKDDIFATPTIPTPEAAPEATPESAATAAHCTNCGAEVEPGRFCTNCGTKN